MSEITADKLNDLRRRVLEHEKRVAAGEAKPDDAPYTRDELKDALAAISLNRDIIATAEANAAPRRRAPAKTIDLDALL